MANPVKGKPPSQPIAEFGECVLYKPHKGNHVAGKLDDRLREGVWLGVSARSGEHFIGTASGVVKSRDILLGKFWKSVGKDVYKHHERKIYRHQVVIKRKLR